MGGILSTSDRNAQSALTPHVVSYCAAMSACEKGTQLDEVLWLLEGMSQSSLTPDVVYVIELQCSHGCVCV